MLPVDISVRSPFKDLFPIREEVLKEIAKDMKKNGYDKSKPISLWRRCGLTVVDGHTRLEAAMLAKIEDIPTVMKEFANEKEALEYAIHCQRNRRNLSDQEILQCVSELDKRKKKGGDRKSQIAQEKSIATPVAIDRSSDETAKVLGVGRGKIEKARAVLDKAPEEIKKAVKAGKMSINKAYNKTLNPDKGSPESLKKATEEISNVKKVFSIVKKRLTKEQIVELIKLLQEDI